MSKKRYLGHNNLKKAKKPEHKLARNQTYSGLKRKNNKKSVDLRKSGGESKRRNRKIAARASIETRKNVKQQKCKVVKRS